MAPVLGPTSGTLSSVSSGSSAWECGVPRFRNSASTRCWVTSSRATSTVTFGSNLSSTVMSSIFWPFTPPRVLMVSKYSLAPSWFSFTPAATEPVKPEGMPMRSCAQAGAVNPIRADKPRADRVFLRSVWLFFIGGGLRRWPESRQRPEVRNCGYDVP
jgi:hypothetical protein